MVLAPIPPLQSLRVLTIATRLKSFTATAEELGVTHSAVSHQIRSLEAWTGRRLFERRGRRMEPTEHAMGLVARTRQALELLETSFGHPVVRREEPGLRVSTTRAFASSWLIPRLKLLSGDGPLLISQISTSVALVDFVTEGVDVAIRYGTGEWPGVQCSRLGGDLSFPVASPELAARLKDGGADALAKAPLIENEFVSWRSWFAASKIPLAADWQPVLRLPDSTIGLDAAEAGLGVVLGRWRMVRSRLEAGRLVRISDLALDDGYGFYLAWPARGKEREAIEILLQRLRIEFEKDALPLDLRATPIARAA